MNRVAVAVVGAGHLGQIHVRLLHERADVELTAVVDPDPDARRRIAERFDLATGESLEAIPDRTDAVVVAAPTCLHFDIVSKLLQQGRHCFVEKPLTVETKEAEELVRLAARQDAVLQVGHVERFNPAWRALPPVESVQFFESVRHSGFPARSLDVGVVHDVMIHDIDLALSVAGELPHRVIAWGQTVVGPHEDVAHAWLEFPGGLTAHLDASRVAPKRQRRVTLVARDGFIECDLDKSEVVTAFQSDALRQVASDVASWPIEQRQAFAGELFDRWMPTGTVRPEAANAIACEHDEFISAVAHGTPVSVTGTAGRDAVRVAQEIVTMIAEQASRAAHRVFGMPPADAA